VRRFRLVIEYDGTDFAGFQIQNQGERTIQGVLEETIERLSGQFSRVHGAGRTDAGVHATGQVVHFDSTWQVPAEKVAVALNAVLPIDLTVRTGGVAEATFHARHDAIRRTYVYTILNREMPSALRGRYVWQVHPPLSRERMQSAANHLIGTHDFATFGLPDAPGKSTVRRMDAIEITPQADCLRIRVAGSAFLKHQVRAFVGTLVEVGRGKLPPDAVKTILESKDRTQCPKVAPPQGLCLVKVEYSEKRNEDLFGKTE
jgi:tRNA pseudouridine38-40 synthase